MKTNSIYRFLVAVLIFAQLVSCSNNVVTTPLIQSETEDLPGEKIEPSDFLSAVNAFSVDRAMESVRRLSTLNPHSGWRGGGTDGEKQAFELIQSELEKMDWLVAQGMTIEREFFHVFVSTQDHTSKLEITANGKTQEVFADAPRGNRDNLTLAAQMDSDGEVGDNEFDPVYAEGEVVWISDHEDLINLQQSDLSAKIALVNYMLVDSSLRLAVSAGEAVQMILDSNPKAVVIYTEYSNQNGASHGTFLGDGAGAFQVTDWNARIPILFFRVEDLSELGIHDSAELGEISFIALTWDVDVINPGESSNLIVHIPGKNHQNPVLVSSHLDSANSPGALDDASGSAILLEIVTVLNEEKIQPESDLYLVWFGSEELVLYGSGYFTTTHSDLINQLQANVQVDCLLRPLDGVPASIILDFSHYVTIQFEDDPLKKYIESRAEELGVSVFSAYAPFSSDNGSFSAFNISNLNLIYMDDSMNEIEGGPWYAGHLHDPYDTVERVEEMRDVFEEMGKLTLSMAFIPQKDQEFVQKEYSKKALFIASHTEAPTMTPMGLPVFSTNLIDSGYEISVLPFGETFDLSDLDEYDLVIVLPPYDFSAVESPQKSEGIAWNHKEAEAVDSYAQSGGTVIILNSANRLKIYNRIADQNEDWLELNTLTSQWGILFNHGSIDDETIPVTFNGKDFSLTLNPENIVMFSAPSDFIAAGTSGSAALANFEIGKGNVIIMADLSMLGETYDGMTNPTLMKELIIKLNE